MLPTVWFRASLHEHIFLNINGPVFARDVIEGDGGRGDVVEVFAVGERGLAAVVDYVEASDSMVMVVVGEPFGDIRVWISDTEANSYVFVGVGWWEGRERCGCRWVESIVFDLGERLVETGGWGDGWVGVVHFLLDNFFD